MSLGPPPINNGDASLPAGQLVAKEDVEADGHIRYTRTTITGASGALGSETYTFTTQRKFRMPGRIKAVVIPKTLSSPGTLGSPFSYSQMTTYVSAPVDLEALAATVTVSYQTSGTLGALTLPRWDPPQWATVDYDVILRPGG